MAISQSVQTVPFRFSCFYPVNRHTHTRNTVVYNLKRRWRRMCPGRGSTGEGGEMCCCCLRVFASGCERTQQKPADAEAFCAKRRKTKSIRSGGELRIALLFLCVWVDLLLLFLFPLECLVGVSMSWFLHRPPGGASHRSKIWTNFTNSAMENGKVNFYIRTAGGKVRSPSH